METPSKISGISSGKRAEDYSTGEEVQADIGIIARENHLLTQVIEVAERFLRKKAPHLLTGPGDRMSSRGSLAGPAHSLTLTSSRDSDSPHFSPARTHSSATTSLTGEGAYFTSSISPYRVNIIYKIEIVDREIEDMKMTMERLRKRFSSATFLLEAEEENFLTDLKTAHQDKEFLDNHINENTDRKTKRVLQDKYLRFLENELQTRDRDLRKLKLKLKTFEIDYKRLKMQQQQKLELRETLHAVDLSKLAIENQQHLQLLEDKTRQLMELKTNVGRKGQNLILLKSRLNDTTLSLKNAMQDIKQKETKYQFVQKKESQNTDELLAAEVVRESMKRIFKTCKSPDVHTYLMMEVRINELSREKNVWERRVKNTRQTLNLLEHQMKQLGPRKSYLSRQSFRSVASPRSMMSNKQTPRKATPYPHTTPFSPTLT